MKTNKWKLDISDNIGDKIIIGRIEDGKPILEMIYEEQENHELLTREEAIDVAKQIIDNWNFSCDDWLE